jgi:hypothetical protein
VNILALDAVADLEAQNCQPAQMANRSTPLDLTASPAIAQNACCGQLHLSVKVYVIIFFFR